MPETLTPGPTQDREGTKKNGGFLKKKTNIHPHAQNHAKLGQTSLKPPSGKKITVNYPLTWYLKLYSARINTLLNSIETPKITSGVMSCGSGNTGEKFPVGNSKRGEGAVSSTVAQTKILQGQARFFFLFHRGTLLQ